MITIATTMRTPNELRVGDQIVINDCAIQIDHIVSVSPGTVIAYEFKGTKYAAPIRISSLVKCVN